MQPRKKGNDGYDSNEIDVDLDTDIWNQMGTPHGFGGQPTPKQRVVCNG
jgi:hypothetical protein